GRGRTHARFRVGAIAVPGARQAARRADPHRHLAVIPSLTSTMFERVWNFLENFSQGDNMNFLSKLLQIVSYLPALVIGVEHTLAPAKGPDKAQAVLSLVQTVVQDIPGDNIKDKDAFNDGLKQINDGVVKCLNASLWHK